MMTTSSHQGTLQFSEMVNGHFSKVNIFLSKAVIPERFYNVSEKGGYSKAELDGVLEIHGESLTSNL